jgi:predicted amidohydrolase
MTSKKTLVALQFNYENKSLEDNFKTLKRLVNLTPKDSMVLAPELCISGYKYDTLKESAQFSKHILDELKKLSTCKTLALTLIEEINGQYFNNLKIFHNEKLIQSRPKAKLFPLGEEEKFFTYGNTKDIQIVELDGIKIATLVCFELRFTELWQQIQGADIIFVPSFWGKLRKEHLKTLSEALAIANQAFVVVANSSDEDMASSSAIITPFGEVYRDDSSFIVKHEAELTQIKKMRRYINIGL